MRNCGHSPPDFALRYPCDLLMSVVSLRLCAQPWKWRVEFPGGFQAQPWMAETGILQVRLMQMFRREFHRYSITLTWHKAMQVVMSRYSVTDEREGCLQLDIDYHRSPGFSSSGDKRGKQPCGHPQVYLRGWRGGARNHDQPREQQCWFSRRRGGLQEQRGLRHHCGGRRLLCGCPKCAQEQRGRLHLGLLQVRSGCRKLTIVRQKAEARERTSTMPRILSMSDLQAAITSLSRFIRKGRKNTPLLPFLTIYLWISTVDLRLLP